MIGNIIASLFGISVVLGITIIVTKQCYKHQGNTGAQDYHENMEDLGKAWRDKDERIIKQDQQAREEEALINKAGTINNN